MGTSSATTEDLAARQAYRAASGTTFAHTASMSSRPRSQQTIHESVDPRRLNTVGEKVRECLDSAEHPLTVPVAVGFDETASMGDAPMLLQEKLVTLKGALLRAGLPDAQLLFAAYGDGHNGEIAPCQAGQFESGLEMEEWLNNLFLEYMGGGNGGESPGLLLYFLGAHSRLDSVTKRGKKGYLILTGDESPHPTVPRDEIKRYIDDDVERDLTIEEVVAMARQWYEVYFFHVRTGAAEMQGSLGVWQKLLGEQYVIPTQGLEDISEQIALLVARLEGTVGSYAEGMDLLRAAGADPDAVARAGSALVPFEAHANSVATVADSEGSLPEPATSSGTKRL